MTDTLEAFIKWYAENRLLDASEIRLCERFEKALVNFLKPWMENK